MISTPVTRRAFVRFGGALLASAILPSFPRSSFAQTSIPPGNADRGKSGILLMNRIAPSSSDLYIANADGSGERKLLGVPAFDYNASFSADGRSIVFTSERNGDGNSDLFRCRVDGSEIQPLVAGPAVDDAAVLSPDGKNLAFVSTREGYRANVWVMDLSNGWIRNLTA